MLLGLEGKDLGRPQRGVGERCLDIMMENLDPVGKQIFNSLSSYLLDCAREAGGISRFFLLSQVFKEMYLFPCLYYG